MRYVALALLVASPALADTHMQRATTAFEMRDYVTARAEFAAAYETDPKPGTLWSWAQAERMSGRCNKALPLYRKYLQSASTPDQIKYATEYADYCERNVGPPPWYKNKLGGALSAGGVVGIGIGIGMFIAASNTASGANNAMYLDDFEHQLDVATDQRRIGAVAFGLGAGLLAAGVMVYVYDSRSHEKQQIVAGTDGRTVFVGARF
jgi:hypothetical protein